MTAYQRAADIVRRFEASTMALHRVHREWLVGEISAALSALSALEPVTAETQARYKPNGIPLTEHERELLTILMEECAEIIQAASKLLRFGKENRPDTGVSNVYTLSAEFGDLEYTAELVIIAGLMRPTAIEEGRFRKRERLARFMQTTADTTGKRTET